MCLVRVVIRALPESIFLLVLASCTHSNYLSAWNIKNHIPIDAEIVADLGNGWIVFELQPDDGDANCFMFYQLTNNGIDHQNGHSGLTQLQDCSKYWNYPDN